MLVKWMLAFGLQGTALITIAPAGVDSPKTEEPPAVFPQQSRKQHNEVDAPRCSLLDYGFRSMYNLDFAPAERQFLEDERENPGNPMGPAAEAAELLFAEFDRLGALQSQIFIKDPRGAVSPKLVPGSSVLRKFYRAIKRAQALAEKRLLNNGYDRDTSLALALSAGLQAELSALIGTRSLATLHYTRQAAGYAKQLLWTCPECYSAYVATPSGKHLVGSQSMPVRWILRANSFCRDKSAPIDELRIAAQHGHYLVPFAEILSSVSYLHKNEPQQARVLPANLQTEVSRSSQAGWNRSVRLQDPDSFCGR